MNTNEIKTMEERFEKLYKTLGYKDELSFEEIPPDIQLKQFIKSEIDLAIENRNNEVVEMIHSLKKTNENEEVDYETSRYGAVLRSLDYENAIYNNALDDIINLINK